MPCGPSCCRTIVWAVVPCRGPLLTVSNGAFGTGSLVQYVCPTPAPLNVSVASTGRVAPVAVSCAVNAPAAGGANRALTEQDAPEATLADVHVSAVRVKAAEPSRFTVSAPLAAVPTLV